MKSKNYTLLSLLCSIIFMFITTTIFPQVQFAAHTIVGGEYSAYGARSIFALDVNGDGDIDVLSASDAKIAWYENNGNENFTPHTITTNVDRALSVFAVDVDSDGDIDVLSASRLDYKIAWYENLNPVGIDDNNPVGAPLQFQLFNNYPNPFNPSTIIRYEIPGQSLPTGGQARNDNMLVVLKVYDVLGSEVATLVNEEKPAGSYEVEFSGGQNSILPLSSGIYFYQLRAGSFIETKKMVLLK